MATVDISDYLLKHGRSPAARVARYMLEHYNVRLIDISLRGRRGSLDDEYSWEGWFEQDGIRRSVGCWDTLTECARHGVAISRYDSGHYEASSKKPS